MEKMIDWMAKFYPIEKEQAYELASMASFMMSQGSEDLDFALKVTLRAVLVGRLALGPSHPLALQLSQLLSIQTPTKTTSQSRKK